MSDIEKRAKKEDDEEQSKSQSERTRGSHEKSWSSSAF
jgi:hypothetical protein